MPKEETKIVNEIMKFVIENSGDCWKVHGSTSQRRGEPDIDGAIPVIFRTSDTQFMGVHVHFKVEVKTEGNYASKIQLYRLHKWRGLDYCTGVVTSLDEFKTLVGEYAKNKTPKMSIQKGFLW